MNKKVLCLDFDGVCHSYTSGWQGASNIPDEAVPGLFEFLEQASTHFDIQIFSSRSHQPGGIEAMQHWFSEQHANQAPFCELPELNFPKEKTNAHITLDDRAITFTGHWPSIESLIAFKPWHKQTNHSIHPNHTLRQLIGLHIKDTTTDEGCLAQALQNAHEALVEISRYNRLNNDLDAYLDELAEWGLGKRDQQPEPASFGLDSSSRTCPHCRRRFIPNVNGLSEPFSCDECLNVQRDSDGYAWLPLEISQARQDTATGQTRIITREEAFPC